MLSRMRPGLNELPGHLVFFGEKQLRRALADCGSSTVEIERVSNLDRRHRLGRLRILGRARVTRALLLLSTRRSVAGQAAPPPAHSAHGIRLARRGRALTRPPSFTYGPFSLAAHSYWAARKLPPWSE